MPEPDRPAGELPRRARPPGRRPAPTDAVGPWADIAGVEGASWNDEPIDDVDRPADADAPAAPPVVGAARRDRGRRSPGQPEGSSSAPARPWWAPATGNRAVPPPPAPAPTLPPASPAGPFAGTGDAPLWQRGATSSGDAFSRPAPAPAQDLFQPAREARRPAPAPAHDLPLAPLAGRGEPSLFTSPGPSPIAPSPYAPVLPPGRAPGPSGGPPPAPSGGRLPPVPSAGLPPAPAGLPGFGPPPLDVPPAPAGRPAQAARSISHEVSAAPTRSPRPWSDMDEPAFPVVPEPPAPAATASLLPPPPGSAGRRPGGPAPAVGPGAPDPDGSSASGRRRDVARRGRREPRGPASLWRRSSARAAAGDELDPLPASFAEVLHPTRGGGGVPPSGPATSPIGGLPLLSVTPPLPGTGHEPLTPFPPPGEAEGGQAGSGRRSDGRQVIMPTGPRSQTGAFDQPPTGTGGFGRPQPDAFGPAAQPDAFGPAAQPDAFGPAAQPDAFGPAAQPDAFGPAAQPDAFGPAAPGARDVGQEWSQPEAFEWLSAPTGSFDQPWANPDASAETGLSTSSISTPTSRRRRHTGDATHARGPGTEPPAGHDDLDPGPAPLGRAGRNLPAAIGVGVVLAGLAIASLVTRPEAFVALVSLVVVLAVWELAGALAVKQIVVPVVPLAVGSLGMLVSAYVAGEEGLLVSFMLTGFGVLLWRIIDGLEGALRDVTAGLFTAAYVPLLAGFAILLLAGPDGPDRVLTFIVVTCASDIGGYLFGVVAGRHPMAPRISPKKSWEGFAGSVLFCLGAGVACVVLLLGGHWYVGLLLGAAAAVCATLGDLSESLIKRDLGVKDMGNLLPGHGGIMDRLDSLLPTAPVAYLILHFLVSST